MKLLLEVHHYLVGFADFRTCSWDLIPYSHRKIRFLKRIFIKKDWQWFLLTNNKRRLQLLKREFVRKFYHYSSMSKTVIQGKDWFKNPFPVLKIGQATGKQSRSPEKQAKEPIFWQIAVFTGFCNSIRNMHNRQQNRFCFQSNVFCLRIQFWEIYINHLQTLF